MGDWELGVFPVRSAAAERFDRSQSAWSYSERWQPPGENLHSAEAAASTTLEPQKTSKPKSLIDQSLKHGVTHEHWSLNPTTNVLDMLVSACSRKVTPKKLLYVQLFLLKLKIEQKIFSMHHIDASFIHSLLMCAAFFLEYSFKQCKYSKDQVMITF